MSRLGFLFLLLAICAALAGADASTPQGHAIAWATMLLSVVLAGGCWLIGILRRQLDTDPYDDSPSTQGTQP